MISILKTMTPFNPELPVLGSHQGAAREPKSGEVTGAPLPSSALLDTDSTSSEYLENADAKRIASESVRAFFFLGCLYLACVDCTLIPRPVQGNSFAGRENLGIDLMSALNARADTETHRHPIPSTSARPALSFVSL
jgi:hypothetical protein